MTPDDTPPPPPAPLPVAPVSVQWVRHLNGEIFHCGTAYEVDVPADAIRASGAPSTHYVANGIVVAYTDAQAAAKAARPSPNHDWSNATFSWTDRRAAAQITADQAAAARFQRDRLLSASDFSQLPDSPGDKPTWAKYRQALRDVPNQAGFPQTIIWPTSP
jgi:tail assembly chaperone